MPPTTLINRMQGNVKSTEIFVLNFVLGGKL